MNKSLLTGLVAGIAVATAGGVAGYAFFGQPSADEQGSAVVEEAAQHTNHAAAAQPAPAPAASQRTAPAPAPVAAVQEECWDEEVAVEAEPRDRHQIAGTALGAVVGGAVAKDVGDRDLTTAVGAAAGAFIGRKIQQEVQEKRAASRTVTTVERRCGPAGSR